MYTTMLVQQSALSRPAVLFVPDQTDAIATGGFRIIERDVGFRE